MLDQYAPTDTVIERFNLFKAEVEKRSRKFDPTDVALSRGVYVAKNEADKTQAIETRLANQRRTAGLRRRPTNRTRQPVELRRHRRGSRRRRDYGSPDEIARKLEILRKAGFEQVLISGPAGSRENLQCFARKVMPALRLRERASRRPRPAGARYSLVQKPLSPALGIPPLIKRNTLLFALSQSFIGAGTQLAMLALDKFAPWRG